MQPDGRHVRQLTFDAGQDRYPDWSPNGRQIAFSSFRNGSTDIYFINEDGSGLTALTTDLYGGSSYPVWSPDGSQIAFSQSRDYSADIYTINADGTGLMKIIDGHNSVYNLYPAWSPDGNSILFVSTENIVSTREFTSCRLVQVNLISGEQIELSAMSAYGTPDWSWVNNLILYYGPYGLSGTVIHTMDSNGGRLSTLTTPPAEGERYDAFPSWSPDGTRVVFHSEFLSGTRDNSCIDFDVFVANADGSGLVNLTPDNDADDMWPDWQPVYLSTANADTD